MKYSFLNMLLTLFEKTLLQLKEMQVDKTEEGEPLQQAIAQLTSAPTLPGTVRRVFIDSAKDTSMRVLTHEEQFKLTKASYQFLMRMVTLGILSSDDLELILTRLMNGEFNFVTLQETKWAIRNTLASKLDPMQLAFLDLVLYQREDGLPLH